MSGRWSFRVGTDLHQRMLRAQELTGMSQVEIIKEAFVLFEKHWPDVMRERIQAYENSVKRGGNDG